MSYSDINTATIPIKSSVDVIIARRKAMNMAAEMGFPKPEATKIAVVVSELTRNIVIYTDGGSVVLTAYGGSNKQFEIVARDNGPGIKDVDRILSGGYSTSKGLGKGVSGSKNIMDIFEIHSIIGKGTTIKTSKKMR
ncbi:anti-sigma regulatory factor [Anaerolineales bacterium HSG6]|nr:anti-sigma regulatory factor [Anaerolineales bacterium HSG6]MDM8532320.1 anti-sigma regulatory factor [Anaerolineales bacterium HSG25]